MKHKRLLLITTCLVFVMICVVALRELFTVKDVNVVYSVTSYELTEEVQSLLEKYKGKSIFSVDTQKITEEITANRYLKVVSVEKVYPNEIVVKLEERTERYYYVANDGTYYFDQEYFIVRKSELPPENNGYLTEVSFSTISNEKLEIECELRKTFNFPNSFQADLDVVCSSIESVNSNVLKISFITTTEQGNYRIRLHMREGVEIEIRKAGDGLEDKLKQGVDFYVELEEVRKIDGVIVILRDESGKITVTHTYEG